MTPTKIAVKPARPGMNLRHPVSGLLPDTGKRWVDDAFTRRRIADGGIVIASADLPDEPDQPAPAKIEAAAPVAAKPLPGK
jgi:hypothetical protein